MGGDYDTYFRENDSLINWVFFPIQVILSGSANQPLFETSLFLSLAILLVRSSFLGQMLMLISLAHKLEFQLILNLYDLAVYPT